jgi:chromosomal replication initiation ATPase DnaA
VVPTVDEIAQAVSQQFGTNRTEIWRKTRGRGSRGPARSVAMYLCQRIGNMTLSEIAATFDLASYASASSTIRMVIGISVPC